MKKVTATCIYSDNMENGERIFKCWNFTVNHNGNNITLVVYGEHDPEPYGYHNFNDMYGSLINILKNNGYYTQVSSEFGRDFYNIQFILIGSAIISKYGYFKQG